MNEGAESHWFSGTSQEPMGMKGMEVEGAGSHTHTHTQKDSPAGLLLFAMLKWGTVNLWGEAVTSVLEV